MTLSSKLAATGAITAILCSPAIAGADDEGAWGLNGTYRAQSNGEWAQTNDSYHDEKSLVDTWTVSSTCSDPANCTGDVRSAQGWSAPIFQKSGQWYVKHVVSAWEPCADGTAVDGLQVFRFYAITPDGGSTSPSSDVLVGEDETTGPSGGCGRNKWLVISMPFKLTRVN